MLTLGDCRTLIPTIPDENIHCVLTDIPYGIDFANWDVLHQNKNSALGGSSPAQNAKQKGFVRRGKPINGWSQADQQRGLEYEQWVDSWVSLLQPKLLPCASVFIFTARRNIHHVINSFVRNGFNLRDIIAWEKPKAHHRAQRISGILEKRGLLKLAEKWLGWRLGNLAPFWEPILWFQKPYPIGTTITDQVVQNQLGAINTSVLTKNIIYADFAKDERKLSKVQKPLQLLTKLIKLVTIEGQTVLDPFAGTGSTLVAAKQLNRKYIGFDSDEEMFALAKGRLDGIV